MKMHPSLLRLAAFFLAAGVSVHAGINVPSADGSDGDLILTNSGPTRVVEIDLSKARDGAWDSPNNPQWDPELGGPGTYDKEKWAVVFRYNSVRIENNVVLVFKNHDARAPVVWLVKTNIVIAGQINLNGSQSQAKTPEGGPGGSRGYYRPGGSDNYRGHLVVDGLRTTSSLIPLRGGFGYSGGGGGAILMCSKDTVAIDGKILCGGGGGDGGAVRVVADNLKGGGELVECGWVRWEVNHLDHSIRGSFVPIYGDPEPVKLWPESGSPSVRIISVENAAAPMDPRAALSPEPFPSGRVFPADMTIRKVEAAKILIETTHFPVSPDSKVVLFAAPNTGKIPGTERGGQSADLYGIRATFKSGNEERAEWLVEAVLPKGHTSLQVHAVGP